MNEASGETVEAYIREVAQGRAEKDAFFRNHRASPVDKAGFARLRYYPVLPQWRVEAVLEPDPAQDVVPLGTSAGDTQPYRRVGRAHFSVAGQTCVLTLYRPTFETPNDHLFIPFRDATSGEETYGAGRYLEAQPGTDRVVLDFNRAYHPYCAYSGRYRCPLPPAENLLDIAVVAGERL